VEVFEEVRYTTVVAEQLVQEDDRRVRKALLLVDLEVHGKWFQKVKKIINIE
jgi:hypothetical protein